MTRNAMDRLAAARPAELDPEPDARRRERDILDAISQPSRPRHPHKRTRTVRRVTLGLAATATVAVAAAAVVTNGGGGGTGGPERTLDARTVLLAAADHADREPAASGMYWHLVRLDTHYQRARSGKATYKVAMSRRTETWTPITPGKEQWVRTQELGAVSATPADWAAWQRAGAPDRVQVQSPTLILTSPRTVSTRPGKVSTSHQRYEPRYWIGRDVTTKQLRALPETPRGLRSWLMRFYAKNRNGLGAVRRPLHADEYLFQVGKVLVTEAPVTAKVRAATFRMLAALGSVKALGERTDSQGRTGVALELQSFFFSSSGPDSGDDRRSGDDLSGLTSGQELIIDPDTGRALADETIVKAEGRAKDFPAGSRLASSVFIEQGWSNTSPAAR
ncbi:MAG TPA: CU044_5270 family protein [Streptosporangiaceae bacterium]|nr:CU044_5270 family protein [Streptosporangiaceae bacterium]